MSDEEYEYDEVEVPYEEVDDQEQRKEILRHQLRRIAMTNPTALDVKLPDKSTLNKINRMELDELEQTLICAQQKLSSSLDRTISITAIHMANQGVGRLLNCVEELNQTTDQDEALIDAVNDYMSSKLIYIPPELKIAVLYSGNVASAFHQASSKRAHQPEQAPEQPSTE